MGNWEANIRKVVPYVPGEQPKEQDIIKLNTNENPYPPAPEVLNKQVELENLRLYPDPAATKLVDAIAEYHGVDKNQVFVGVGSDDVLAMSFMTFFNSGKPLDADFRIKASDYYGENGGVVFPNPNAPTGIAEPVEFVRDIVSHNPDVIVIVDEAYVDFGGQTALPLLKEFDNLLVVRTFSKSRSMAGLRIGYALGNEKLIGYLNDVKYSYNSYTMDLTSIELGTCSIKADDYFKEMVKKVVDTRTWFVKEIEALGFTVLPSSANFVFATHKTIPAKEIFEKARENKIFVRYFDKPRIDNYLRISIGTDKEMQLFVAFLKTLL